MSEQSKQKLCGFESSFAGEPFKCDLAPHDGIIHRQVKHERAWYFGEPQPFNWSGLTKTNVVLHRSGDEA